MRALVGLLVVGCSVPPPAGSPAPPPLVDARAAGITFGTDTGCLWTPDGGAACWGGGCDEAEPGTFLGELCSNDARAMHDVVQVSVQEPLVEYLEQVCFLQKDGAVWCWRHDTDAPVRIGVPPAKALASGSYGTCALLPSGDVWCWGLEQPTPVHEIANAISIEAVDDNYCATLPFGVACWQDLPFAAPSPLAGTLPGDRVALGWSHSYLHIGITQIFGNTEGQGRCVIHGDGSADCAAPTPDTTMHLDDAAGFAIGLGHACALDHEGGVACWRADETIAPVGLRHVTQIAGGWNQTCARLADDTVWCWGFGKHGETGRNRTGDYDAEPVRLAW